MTDEAIRPGIGGLVVRRYFRTVPMERYRLRLTGGA